MQRVIMACLIGSLWRRFRSFAESRRCSSDVETRCPWCTDLRNHFSREGEVFGPGANRQVHRGIAPARRRRPVHRSHPDRTISAAVLRGGQHFAQASESAGWFPEGFAALQIMDHSPPGRAPCPLARWETRRRRIGNCWVATNEIIEEAGASAFGADSVDPMTPAAAEKPRTRRLVRG